MAKTDRERKQAQRERRVSQGLKQYQIWLHPSLWPLVKRYIERLSARKEK